uniref:Uncharacterized protein n=1 Tax=Heterorhabditis bacteriophora TaxID=37862 RepID=A0A1I7WXR9_HETBA
MTPIFQRPSRAIGKSFQPAINAPRQSLIGHVILPDVNRSRDGRTPRVAPIVVLKRVSRLARHSKPVDDNYIMGETALLWRS